MLDKRAEGFVAALAGQVASTTMLSEVVLNGGSEADRVVDAAIGTVDDAELQQLLKQLGALVLEVGFFIKARVKKRKKKGWLQQLPERQSMIITPPAF